MREESTSVQAAQRAMAWYRVLDRELTPSVKDFERRVYLQGLALAIDACPRRGMSGTLAGVAIRTYVIAGRVMVTLERGNASVSVLAAEGETSPRMGLHSCEGEVAEARDLINAVIAAWPEDAGERAAVLHADDTVSLI